MSRAACYQVLLSPSDKRSLTFGFSPTMGESPSPWPGRKWKKEIRQMEEGVFDSVSQGHMKSHWTIINPIVLELPDVIGRFGVFEDDFPAVCRKLKEAIEAEDPELCSFVPVERLYDLRHDRVIEDPQYYFTAVRQHKDSIDSDAGETGARGSTKVSLHTDTRIRRSALDGAMLWRDTRSRQVLCNERFKALAEKAGCVGMYFYELTNI